jgi:hypothetical protein
MLNIWVETLVGQVLGLRNIEELRGLPLSGVMNGQFFSFIWTDWKENVVTKKIRAWTLHTVRILPLCQMPCKHSAWQGTSKYKGKNCPVFRHPKFFYLSWSRALLQLFPLHAMMELEIQLETLKQLDFNFFSPRASCTAIPSTTNKTLHPQIFSTWCVKLSLSCFKCILLASSCSLIAVLVSYCQACSTVASEL